MQTLLNKKKKAPKPMSDAQIGEAARLFRVLSEPSRLLLLRSLMDGPMVVGELVTATDMSQANVSKHLALLQQSRFVSREREGNFAIYQICDPRLKELCHLMCRRIDESARDLVRKLRI